MNPTVTPFSSPEDFISASTDFILEKIQTAASSASSISPSSESSPRVLIGLSGGSTPGPIYSRLANSPIPQFTHFFQIDERYIPANHKDSNNRLIQETLLSTPQIPEQNFHAFDTSLPITDCVSAYEKTLLSLSNPFRPTLSILGIGPDGHTASLFPSSPALNEESKLTAHTTTDEFAIHDRLTLTFPAILASETLLVLLKGSSKSAILDKLLKPNPSEKLPAHKLLEHPNLHIYFGDF